MLIHLTPKIFNPHAVLNLELVDVNITQFNLSLVGGVDIVARKPYPNKCFSVVCRKIGRKAINGILVKGDDSVRNFSVDTRWCFNAERIIKHTVNYSILDNEFGFVTDEPTAWYKYGNYKSRWPQEVKTPSKFKPTMTILHLVQDESREGNVRDTFEDGWLVHRLENIGVPSVEKERLFGDKSMIERMPCEEHAFEARIRTSG